jgi:AhpD family alkylhydroperoxidase
MSRIPLIDPASASPDVRAVYQRLEDAGLGKFLHQAQALAHHPPLLHAVAELLLAYYHSSLVEQRYLELGVLAVSARNACDYCVIHHTPQALDTGLRQEQVDAVVDGSWRTHRELFGATDLTVLEYAEQMTYDANRVSDELFARMQAAFSTEQLLELTMRIATCGFFNRFNDVLRLPVEPVAEELFRTARAERRSA